jgi:hypothetical protein
MKLLLRKSLRGGSAATLAALLAASTLASMAPAQALDAAGVGPRDPSQSGFPAYYTDDSGVALQLCVDGSANCGGATLASDGAGGAGVNVAPDGEGFWWMATTSLSAPGVDVDIEVAAEAAWLDARTPISFDRLRIRGHSDVGDVTVTTPYGAFTVPADGTGVRNLNLTEDVGCALAPCNFRDMTTLAEAHITSWITSTTPPAGYLGDSVTSEPATVGGAAATVSIPGDSTTSWVVMGKKANANAVSLPNALDFGNVAKATTKSVTLVNLGTTARNLGGVTLTGDKTITRLASSTCSATTVLAVGQRCKVDLRYKPGAAKQSAAKLTITDDAAARTVKVSARTSAEVKAPTAVQFKPVRSGGSGKTHRIVVTNTGSKALNITGVSLGGRSPNSFDIRSGAPKVCARGTSVAPGKQCAAYVGFEPKGFGPKRASLKIRSNALGGARSIALSGNAR